MVRAVVTVAVVLVAARSARAGPRCAAETGAVAVLEVPACWDADTARAAREAVDLELATYGVSEVTTSPAQDAGPARIAVRVTDACDGDEVATLYVDREGRGARSRVSLADVAPQDRPRILALAIGELLAGLCEEPETVAPASVAETAAPTASAVPTAVDPPPGLASSRPAVPRRRSATRDIGLVGAGEARWFAAHDSMQLGASAGGRVSLGPIDAGAGLVWFRGTADDELGDVVLQTLAGRVEARRAILAVGRLGVAGVARIEVGTTFGTATADGFIVSARDDRALYLAAAAGADVTVAVTPWLVVEVSATAGYGRGLIGAAAERDLIGTGGMSMSLGAAIAIPL